MLQVGTSFRRLSVDPSGDVSLWLSGKLLSATSYSCVFFRIPWSKWFLLMLKAEYGSSWVLRMPCHLYFHEGSELIDKMPAGGAQEYVVQLQGFVGQAKHVCWTSQATLPAFCYAVLTKCSAAVEKTILLSALCVFLPLCVFASSKRHPYFTRAPSTLDCNTSLAQPSPQWAGEDLCAGGWPFPFCWNCPRCSARNKQLLAHATLSQHTFLQ